MENIRTTLRINEENYLKLKTIASAKGKSFNTFINEILHEKLESYDVDKLEDTISELKEL